MPGASRAADLIQSVEIYEDTTGRETIETIASRTFSPSAASINKGYTASVFWLRIRLKANPRPVDDIMLQVAPSTVESLTFYQRDGTVAGGWATRDAFRDLSTSLLGIHVHSERSTAIVYLRATSVGTMRLMVGAYALDDALRLTIGRTALRTAYLAALAVLVIWASRAAYITRDPIFLGFALLESLWIAHNLFAFGLAQLIPFDWIARNREPVYRLLVLGVSLLTAGFHHHLMSMSRAAPAVLWALRAVQAAMVIAAALYLAGFQRHGLQLNANAITFVPLILLAGALTIRSRSMPDLLQLKVIYIAYSLVMMLWAFGLTGLLPPLISNDLAIMTHGISTGTLIFVVLNAHSRKFLRRLAKAESSLMEERLRGGMAREHNTLLARFIDMLAHETRNAHAVVRMNLSAATLPERPRDRIDTTLARLDSIIERSVHVAQFEAGAVSVLPESIRLDDMLRDLLATLPDGDRVSMVRDAPETVRTDRLLLKVAVINLVENALKYSPAESPVRLILSQDGNDLSISVQNDIGRTAIPAPHEAFRKFHRGKGTEMIPGTGLGLYLVQTIATLLGGQVAYRSDERTVQFTFRIPC